MVIANVQNIGYLIGGEGYNIGRIVLFTSICKSREGDLGNGMRGMMGMQRIRVGMRGIRVEMWGMEVGMWGMW